MLTPGHVNGKVIGVAVTLLSSKCLSVVEDAFSSETAREALARSSTARPEMYFQLLGISYAILVGRSEVPCEFRAWGVCLQSLLVAAVARHATFAYSTIA